MEWFCSKYERNYSVGDNSLNPCCNGMVLLSAAG